MHFRLKDLSNFEYFFYTLGLSMYILVSGFSVIF